MTVSFYLLCNAHCCYFSVGTAFCFRYSDVFVIIYVVSVVVALLLLLLMSLSYGCGCYGFIDMAAAAILIFSVL